ncbi:hypothetical protein [Nostoc sp.]|uniref:hypothetical protein n=1 Tax=Nostoc sp. TaxID=1180 RepID=UPI002FFD25BB
MKYDIVLGDTNVALSISEIYHTHLAIIPTSRLAINCKANSPSLLKWTQTFSQSSSEDFSY